MLHGSILISVLSASLASDSNVTVPFCSPSPGRRTLTLGRVEQWACQGRYSRLEQLQSDLLSLLREARESSAIDSQVWTL